jgi:drug/metabolite transporter (DMT)-like permease
MTAPYPATVITRSDQRAVVSAIAGAASISASAILVTLAGTGAATTAFYRCLIALPLLFGLAVVERRRRGPRNGGARVGALVAGLFFAVDLVLWNHAIADVGAGIATVIGNLQVVFVTITAWLLFRERPPRLLIIMLPVVMAGVVLVSGLIGRSTPGSHPLAGIGYGLGTSVAYAGFLLILRRTTSGTPHVAGPLAEATAGGAVGSLLLGLMFGGLRLEMPWASFGWLVVLAITSQTVGWLLITLSLPRLPAALSSLLLLLQPAAALLLAYVVLGERASLLQLGGAAVVCTGVLVVSLATKPSAAPLPADQRAGSGRANIAPRGDLPAATVDVGG